MGRRRKVPSLTLALPCLAVVVVLLAVEGLGRTPLPGVRERSELPLERGAGGAETAAGPTPVTWGVNLSPLSGAFVALGLTAEVNVPSGVLDAGARVPVSMGLTTDGNATLTFGGFGLGRSVSMPILGNSSAFPIPGANYTVDGISLQVYASVVVAVGANCTVTDGGAGCPSDLSWTRSGSVGFELAAPLQVPGNGSLSLALRNLSLAGWLNLSARGPVPFLGNVTVPIGSPLRIADVAGRPDSVAATWEVAPPPTFGAITTEPNPARGGSEVRIGANLSGGVPPFRYDYVTLPPGCWGTDRPSVTCVAPEAAGTYPIEVRATDADGETATGTGTMSVVANASSGANSGAAGSGGGPLDGPNGLAAAGVAVAALAAVAILRSRRRRRSSL